MIDSKTAAKIARKAGLTLSDASALQRLADTEEEAVQLAELFSEERESPDQLAARIPRGW